jgi:hypothetical protein
MDPLLIRFKDSRLITVVVTPSTKHNYTSTNMPTHQTDTLHWKRVMKVFRKIKKTTKHNVRLRHIKGACFQRKLKYITLLRRYAKIHGQNYTTTVTELHTHMLNCHTGNFTCEHLEWLLKVRLWINRI